jgi:hypothetical protein
LCLYGYRGFESHPLRQPQDSSRNLAGQRQRRALATVLDRIFRHPRAADVCTVVLNIQKWL